MPDTACHICQIATCHEADRSTHGWERVPSAGFVAGVAAAERGEAAQAKLGGNVSRLLGLLGLAA